MGEYFKPLRRKFGIITLAATCALAMFWARGFAFRDDFGFPVGDQNLCLSSGRGEFRFEMARPDWDGPRMPLPRWEARLVWLSEPIGNAFVIDDLIGDFKPWRWRGEYSILGMQAIWFRVRCWSIVIPLTLLSAWLLFSEPKDKVRV